MVTLEKKRGTGDGGQTVIVIDPATGLPVPGATNPSCPVVLQGPRGVPGQDGTSVQGNPGVSITTVTINGSNHLIVTLDNGTQIDAGPITVGAGGDMDNTVENARTEGNHLILVYEDGTEVDKGPIDNWVTDATVSGDELLVSYADGTTAIRTLPDLDNTVQDVSISGLDVIITLEDGTSHTINLSNTVVSIAIVGGHLISTMLDGSTQDAGDINAGPTGARPIASFLHITDYEAARDSDSIGDDTLVNIEFAFIVDEYDQDLGFASFFTTYSKSTIHGWLESNVWFRLDGGYNTRQQPYVLRQVEAEAQGHGSDAYRAMESVDFDSDRAISVEIFKIQAANNLIKPGIPYFLTGNDDNAYAGPFLLFALSVEQAANLSAGGQKLPAHGYANNAWGYLQYTSTGTLIFQPQNITGPTITTTNVNANAVVDSKTIAILQPVNPLVPGNVPGAKISLGALLQTYSPNAPADPNYGKTVIEVTTPLAASDVNVALAAGTVVPLGWIFSGGFLGARPTALQIFSQNSQVSNGIIRVVEVRGGNVAQRLILSPNLLLEDLTGLAFVHRWFDLNDHSFYTNGAFQVRKSRVLYNANTGGTYTPTPSSDYIGIEIIRADTTAGAYINAIVHGNLH